VLNRTAMRFSGKRNSNKSNILRWGALGLLFFPLAVTQAADPSRQEKTFDTTANPQIGLSNLMGRVVVKAWDRQQVHVLYTINSPKMSVDIDQLPQQGAAEKIHFTTRMLDPQASGSEKTVVYTLEVPIGTSLEVRNTEGQVEIDRIAGDAYLDSSGGVITISDVSGHIVANSIDGNIEILRPAGKVEAYTICGNIRFVGATGPSMRAQTTSGNITYEGDLMSGADYFFRNYRGDIDLYLPSSASFELNKATLRGKFVSDFSSGHSQARHPYPGAHTFLGTNVSSTATVRLSSYSGNVHIHKQN
jgi:DUF4097 and DUF4098 domain-containing protein YvlB